MTEVTRKFPGSLADFWEKAGKTEWSEVKMITAEVAKALFKGLTALFLYWQAPAFFWTSFIIGIVIPHVTRESLIGRIWDVWEESMGWTTALLTVGAFLALPSTLIVGSIISGAKIGSDLSITSQIKKRLREYQEFTKQKLSKEDKEAFSDFLFTGNNLCLYEKLFQQVQNLQGSDESTFYNELHHLSFQLNGAIAKDSKPKKIRRLILDLLDKAYAAKITQYEEYTHKKLNPDQKGVFIRFLGNAKNFKVYEKLFDHLKNLQYVPNKETKKKDEYYFRLTAPVEESGKSKEILKCIFKNLMVCNPTTD